MVISRRRKSSKPKTESARDRVRSHRERLRKQGMRPFQIWVPDVKSWRFKAEAHRQSFVIANSPYEADDQAFLEAIAVGLDE
jgi:antidote-toxin recognition MazE-like antitoxin